ncbi:GNAT family N-acetyltransferase [Vibrio caribbeanicus]|uniref:GNAT family N-acetyltransferase n=1 Tax=Vibrio caribbeanicus TaxID=701175 RepID=UPI0030DA2B1A
METEIRTFIENDYVTLISWIDNEELNFQWGGPCFTFPLDLDQLRNHYKNSKVHPFILTVSSQPIGYVELMSESDFRFRICRVYIHDGFRGKGLAKKMLMQVIRLARENYRAKVLSLAVFKDNSVAKHCYQSLGFIEKQMIQHTFKEKCWDLLMMEKTL